MIRHIGGFFQFLERLWAWIPILWHDQDWDSSYLFEIMRFKISRMRKEIGKNDRHVCAQKNCKHMRIAELYLERIVNNDTPHGNPYFCSCPDETMTYNNVTGLEFHTCAACRDITGTNKSHYHRQKWEKKNKLSHKPKRPFCIKSELYDAFYKHFKRNVRNWWD